MMKRSATIMMQYNFVGTSNSTLTFSPAKNGEGIDLISGFGRTIATVTTYEELMDVLPKIASGKYIWSGTKTPSKKKEAFTHAN